NRKSTLARQFGVRERESDSDGGLGTSLLPFYAAAKWRCAAVNSGEWCRPSRGWTGPADSPPKYGGRGPRIGERIPDLAMFVKYYYKLLVNRSNGAAKSKSAA